MIQNDIIAKKDFLRAKYIGKNNINAIGIFSNQILTVYSNTKLQDSLIKQIQIDSKPFDVVFNIAPIAKLS
jgi:hypothetical protein